MEIKEIIVSENKHKIYPNQYFDFNIFHIAGFVIKVADELKIIYLSEVGLTIDNLEKMVQIWDSNNYLVR